MLDDLITASLQPIQRMLEQCPAVKTATTETNTVMNSRSNASL